MDQAVSYDAVIIGFGKGGKTLAAALGAAGKRTALIERSAQMYGGTCINVGCIPSKYLVKKAREAAAAETFAEKQQLYREAIQGKDGLTGRLREKNLQKLLDAPNVDVITGTAKLLSARQVEVETGQGVQVLEAGNIFLNTGAHPVIPSTDGMQDNPRVMTSEGLLALDTLPKHLVIVGGGYIGVEFASIYADFGSQVTVIQHGTRFLPREDSDIAAAVLKNLERRGVRLLTQASVQSVGMQGDQAVVSVSQDGKDVTLLADAVLVATGRRPNMQELGLENAGIELTPRGGLVVDGHLQTTAPGVFAMGDVVGGLQFTYISLDDYRVVKSAVLEDGGYTVDARGTVPYSVFLNPPFSRVGMTEQEAMEMGHAVKVVQLPAAAIPKAQVLEQPDGLLKAVVDMETRQILGVHLFCEESHEVINIVKLAMDAKLPYTVLRDMVFTHPTMSEALNDLFA